MEPSMEGLKMLFPTGIWNNRFLHYMEKMNLTYYDLDFFFTYEVAGHIGYYAVKAKEGFVLIPYSDMLTSSQPRVNCPNMRKITKEDLEFMKNYETDDLKKREILDILIKSERLRSVFR